ncbi:MAG: response regulator [Bacteroidota bacterium]
MKRNGLPLIFVVDDDAVYCNLLKDYLYDEKYRKVEIFSSGEECIANMHKKPEIVLLDHSMDSMNGIEVLKKINKSHPDTGVIFLSGQERVQVALDALRSGAFDYIVKNDSAFHRLKMDIIRVRKFNKMISENTFYKKQIRAMTIGFLVMALLIGSVIILS